MSSEEVLLRPIRDSDLQAVVEVHLQSFPGFFLTFLGRGFLTLLYRGLISDGEGTAIVAVGGSGIVGFVAGVERQAEFYKRLLKHKKWSFAFATMGALVRNPGIAPRLLRALRRPKEARESAAAACLMSIAISPGAEGGGLGTRLLDAFSQEMKSRGVRSFCLTTDRDNNARVIRFYERFGFRLQRTFTTREGRRMNEYVFDIGGVD